MMRQRQAGEPVTLRLDGATVQVRCTVDTYALSAHADENELLQYAQALGVEEVMLVHGDPGARHSLATALRQRVRRVQTPRIGQTLTFAFARRPWALGGLQRGKEERPFDSAAAWAALKGQAGSFFSAGELAKMWWGDDARQAEVVATLSDDLYFAADWRHKDTFQVRSAEQVARKVRLQEIMLAHPGLVGQLAVLRDANGRPRLGLVVDAGAEGFEARVLNAEGRHYPADALVWALGPWQKVAADKGLMPNLRLRLNTAEQWQDQLLPFGRRQELVAAGTAVDPATLLPVPLPEGLDPQGALLTVVWALARDGAALTDDGLLPQRVQDTGPIEQNQARDIALHAFPAEARLRKVGLEVHRSRLTLTFDFPATAQKRYADVIEAVIEATGWEVVVSPAVNQQALGAAVLELLPPPGRVVKGPSFHLAQGEVHVEVIDVVNVDTLVRDYQDLTGFRLRVGGAPASPRGETAGGEVVAAPAGAGGEGALREPMEINAAYELVREALEPYGLQRVGLKQGALTLTFISPQVGERHLDVIRKLADLTGYGMSIHPHPNQNDILHWAGRLAREAGWRVLKGPGIHVARAEVAMKLAEAPEVAVLADVEERLMAETGYRLVVEA